MIGDAADMLDRLQKALPPWFDQVLLAASDEGEVVTPTDDAGILDFSLAGNDLIASAG